MIHIDFAAVGKDRASVMRQIDELSGDLELLVAFGGIGRLKPRGGAVAHQPDLALCEQALHPRALLLADGRLNTMLVGGPQLDGFEAGSFEHADNRFHIEILQQVVRDGAQMKSGTAARSRRGQRREGGSGRGCA